MKYLEKNGRFASVVSIDHLDELGEEIRSLHDQRLLSDVIYNYTGTERPYHRPRLPRSLPRARSIIVVATPQPTLRTTFNWQGKKHKLIIPPTYFDYFKVVNQARNLLKEAFKPGDYRFVRAVLPQKLLAVRSGLAMYGRNNITYVPGIGSLYRPSVFYTDYDSPVDYWQEKKALPLCEKCRACLRACPTNAIREDRFLIRAETCLTYLNEKPSKEKFPTGVDPSAHNALIGCLRCQRACPYNKEVIDRYEDRLEFTEEETGYLLAGVFRGRKAAKMKEKLLPLGLDLSTFPRNLEVLIK